MDLLLYFCWFSYPLQYLEERVFIIRKEPSLRIQFNVSNEGGGESEWMFLSQWEEGVNECLYPNGKKEWMNVYIQQEKKEWMNVFIPMGRRSEWRFTSQCDEGVNQCIYPEGRDVWFNRYILGEGGANEWIFPEVGGWWIMDISRGRSGWMNGYIQREEGVNEWMYTIVYSSSLEGEELMDISQGRSGWMNGYTLYTVSPRRGRS